MDDFQLHEQWIQLCSTLRARHYISDGQFDAFFTQLEPQAISPDEMVLCTINAFVKSWIERNFSNYITTTLQEMYQWSPKISIRLIEPDSAGENINGAAGVNVGASEAQPSVPNDMSGATQIHSHSSNAGGMSREGAQVGGNVIGNAAVHLKDAYQNTQTRSRENKECEPSGAGSETQNKKTTPLTGPFETAPTQAFESVPEGAVSDHNSIESAYTFENFVIGDSNRMAYSMSIEVAGNPGNRSLNPLFIYGKSGLGKTHLVRAIEDYIRVNLPHYTRLYKDASSFLNEFIEASMAHDKSKHTFRDFQNAYENVDVLLIDDVQLLQGKKQTLEILFQIINTRIEKGMQIILSADRAPKNIDIDERYYSRFNSGGTVDIQPPEIETKLSIIRNFIREYNRISAPQSVTVPEEIEMYIAENSGSNIRELKSAITKVISQIKIFGSDALTLPTVRKLLENHFSGGAMRQLTIKAIQEVVEDYYKIKHDDLVGAKRSRDISYPRQIAIYLCREMLDIPFALVGESFGGRDHATIIYAVKSIEDRLEKSREVQEEIELIQKLIREK